MHDIRLATPADWAAWHALDARLPRELFESKCAAGECYVAGAGGAVEGLLRWNRFWDEVPFCTLLMVDEAHRQQGLGRALMARWEVDMAAAGHGMVMTSTQVDETAQHFYRKLGYRDAGGFAVDIPGYAQPLELILIKKVVSP